MSRQLTPPGTPGLLALVRLLQLASPTLPVGAYTYSQGLEWAVECGAVRSEAEAGRWIGDLLEWNLASFEAPLMAQQYVDWAAGDDGEVPQRQPGSGTPAAHQPRRSSS